MSRNNNDRLGATTLTADTPAPAVAVGPSSTGQAPLSWSTPTEIVTLPSGGRFYSEGHPLHNKESVEVRFMTAKEEDILTSQALIKNGVVLDRLIESVVIDKAVKANNLLVGDKNAILVATRITGYGSEYNTTVTCPACEDRQRYEFLLEEAQRITTGEGVEGVEFTDKGTFTFTLPLLQLEVECRLLTGTDEQSMIKSQRQKKKLKLGETVLTDQLRHIVVSIAGDATPNVVSSFIAACPARDSRFIRETYAKVAPNLTLHQNFACENCGHEEEVEVPLTAEFFWPKQ